jgi:hypothetical protein
MGKKQKHKPWAVRPNPKNKAPGAKVLAGFSVKKKIGKLLFCAPYSKLNKERVCAIFKRSLIPGLKRFYPQGQKRFNVQQDGDRSLNAALVVQELRAKGVHFWQREGGKLTPPARSGDLWPMETVWADVSRRLKARVLRSKTYSKGVGTSATAQQLDAWTAFVSNTVRSTNPNFLYKLHKGMPKRMDQCIERNGGPISK